jgi:hypothetical protein
VNRREFISLLGGVAAVWPFATGAPRERGYPPWVVLGVKATEALGVRAA